MASHLVFACLGFAMLTVTACSDAGIQNTDANSESFSADNFHRDDDPTLPAPNDDPALGNDIDVDTGSPEDEVVLDVPTEEGVSEDALSGVRSPVPGHRVTYAFGVRNSRYQAGYHTGHDYAARSGTKVVAVRSGKVRWSNNAGGAYGRWIGIEADNGRTYVYCHLSARYVRPGTRVTVGTVLGRVGTTGNVTGPHLHFEDHPRGPFVYGRVRRPAW